MVPETRAPHNKGTFTGSLSRAAPGSVNVLCQASLQTYFSKCKSAVKVIEGPKEPGEIKSHLFISLEICLKTIPLMGIRD